MALYLPRLVFYVEGLTIEDLRQYLTKKFSKYVLDPQAMYVRQHTDHEFMLAAK